MSKYTARYGGTKKKSSGLIVLWVFLALLLLAVAGAVAVWNINEFSLDVTLSGEETVVAEYGNAYSDAGATASFYGTLLRREPVEVPVTVSGTVDADHLGEYTLTYSASYSLDCLVTEIPFSESCQRKVKVQDTKAPEITLVSNPETFTIPGEVYLEEGFSAADNHDGDITANVARKEENGVVTYTVADSSGNQTTVTREIYYYDPIAPVLELSGSQTITIMKGSQYQEPGYSAQDNCEGDITSKVVVTGEVDTEKLGSYELTYTVTDAYGNEATAKRTVKVWMTNISSSDIPNLPTYDPQNPPEPNGKTIYLTFDDGPSPYTQRLLDILEAYGVKATFFVVSNGYSHMLSKIAAGGHTVAMHSATHNYAKIYASDEAYFNDLHTIESIIIRETGTAPKLLRFPGGTSNTVSRHYSTGIMTRISQQVREMGYRYYDWHVSSEDAVDAYTVKAVYENVVNGILSRNRNYTVVLQHDTNEASVNAVEAILIWGLANGYTFEALTESSPGCTARPAN